MSTKTATAFRCFLCDRVSRDEANFTMLLPSGLLCCADCREHDSAAAVCTCGSFYFTGCLCGVTVAEFRAGRIASNRPYDLS